MPNRPTWRALVAGTQAPAEDRAALDPGEFPHGWQRSASSALEHTEHRSLLRALAGTSQWGPLPGRARLRSCGGPSAAAWMTAVPATQATALSNEEFLCSMRRRLGLGVVPEQCACEGCGREVDLHGHHRAACGRTGRVHARHTSQVAAWRQVFVEAGGFIPRRNVERLLRNTHVPTPSGDNRRFDLVVPGLSIARGLPLSCDVTCVAPLTGRGYARPGATMPKKS